jgi:hypothetical protein
MPHLNSMQMVNTIPLEFKSRPNSVKMVRTIPMEFATHPFTKHNSTKKKNNWILGKWFRPFMKNSFEFLGNGPGHTAPRCRRHANSCGMVVIILHEFTLPPQFRRNGHDHSIWIQFPTWIPLEWSRSHTTVERCHSNSYEMVASILHEFVFSYEFHRNAHNHFVGFRFTMWIPMKWLWPCYKNSLHHLNSVEMVMAMRHEFISAYEFLRHGYDHIARFHFDRWNPMKRLMSYSRSPFLACEFSVNGADHVRQCLNTSPPLGTPCPVAHAHGVRVGGGLG